MKNTIIDKNGDPVIISATALTPIAFKHTFGEDMLKTLAAIHKGETDKAEMIDACGKMAFIMAAQAANENNFEAVMSLTINDYYKFLNGFNSDAFTNEQTQVTVIGTWFNNADVIEKAKNPASRPNAT